MAIPIPKKPIPEEDPEKDELSSMLRQCANKYQIIRSIFTGNYNFIWKVRNEDLGRDEAVKHPVDANLSLLNEAQTMAGISHENVVEIYYFKKCSNPYGELLFMEYLPGCNLKKLIRNNPLQLEEFIPYLIQTCAGLNALHLAGLVHRDIKPTNIQIVQREGSHDRVKIMDLGSAQRIKAEETTGFNSTLPYSAPELSEHKKASPSSDIYSFGVTIYEVLTKERPFTENDYNERIRQKNNRDFIAGLKHEKIRPALMEIIWGCLEPNPEKRKYKSIPLFLADLERIGLSVSGTPTIISSAKPKELHIEDILETNKKQIISIYDVIQNAIKKSKSKYGIPVDPEAIGIVISKQQEMHDYVAENNISDASIKNQVSAVDELVADIHDNCEGTIGAFADLKKREGKKLSKEDEAQCSYYKIIVEAWGYGLIYQKTRESLRKSPRAAELESKKQRWI